MSENITIPNDRWTDALITFVDHSPLSACTTLGFDGGVRILRADRDVALFSTGERNLWDLLKSLTHGDLHTVLNHADTITLAALGDLFARLTLDQLAS